MALNVNYDKRVVWMLGGPWFGVRNRIICCRGACPSRPPGTAVVARNFVKSICVHGHRARQIIDIYRPRYTHKHIVIYT